MGHRKSNAKERVECEGGAILRKIIYFQKGYREELFQKEIWGSGGKEIKLKKISLWGSSSLEKLGGGERISISEGVLSCKKAP